MVRIVLTGSTGFVGRAVTRHLHADGHQICHVIRQGSADKISVLGPDDHVVEVTDLFDQTAQWWGDFLQPQDVVLHLAWYAEPGVYQTSVRNLQCVSGTLALAQGAIVAGVQRWVGVGTCLEYDLSRGDVGPDAPLNPRSPYAAAKVACAVALGAMFAQTDIGFLWARLFYLYGAEEDPRRLVAYLHRQLSQGHRVELTAGTQIRDFMDVEDAARLLVDDALSDRQGASNIASGLGVTVRQLAETIADQYGRRDLLQFGCRPENPDDPPVVVGLRTSAADPARPGPALIAPQPLNEIHPAQ